jgi:flagellar hook protein FlgE
MALNNALITGLSGLDVSQTWLGVIGNNIANSNTTAFKASNVQFTPQFYVTTTAGTSSSASFGGTNPSQYGLGASVASINKDFSAGAIESTGSSTDLAIDGNGFFIVKGAAQNYTQDGEFQLNNQNQLVNAQGDFVQGYGVDSNFNVVQGPLQTISIPVGQTTIAKATTNIKIVGDLNAAGTVAAGASILTTAPLVTASTTTPLGSTTLLTDLRDASDPTGSPLMSVGDTLKLTASKGGQTLPTDTYTVTATSTVTDLEGFLQNGTQIDTGASGAPGPTPGVNFAPSPTDTAGTARFIITGNSGMDNSLGITTSGFVNAATGVSPFTFTDGIDAAGDASAPSGESVATSLTAYDSLGNPMTINVTAVLESKSSSGTSWRYYASSVDNQGGTAVLGNATLNFDNGGNLLTVSNNTITLDRQGTGSQPVQNITLDFSGVHALSDATSSVLEPTSQDGSPLGTLSSFSIGTDGTVTGSFSNGLTRTLGQVALATFNNPEGLVDQGSNLFSAGAGSGQAVISAPQTLGAGEVLSGSLEQSNVNISKEFINMIIASTGFSASSRVITTSDQLITDLLNSTR